MAYEQIYPLINAGVKEALGANALTVKDTSTLAEVGGQILTDETGLAMSAFVYGLAGAMMSTRIKNKAYSPLARVSAYRDADAFGLYKRKIQISNVQDAKENTSYKAQNWSEYNGDLSNNWIDRLFGQIAGFETQPTIVSRKKLQRCFSSPAEMASFIDALDTSRMNDIACQMETSEILARATAMASCFASTNTAIDLGAIYNNVTGKATAPDSWLYDAELDRFMLVEMKRILERLKPMNRIYNNAGCDRFTRDDELVVDIHTDFIASLEGYLQNTLIAPFLTTPTANKVTRWQALGTTYAGEDVHKLNVSNSGFDIASAFSADSETLEIDGVVAFAHDVEKYALTIEDLRTVSANNNSQEMVTTVTKYDVQYAIDPSEQGVVFFVGTHNAS